MSKEMNYPEFIGAQITKEQQEKVKKSGLSNSEFIRNAIDFYDDVRLSSNLEYKIRIVGECIETLKVYQINLKNQYFQTFKDNGGNVKKEVDLKGNLKGLNPEVYKETPETFKDNGGNIKASESLKGLTLKDNGGNIKELKNKKLVKGFESIEDTLARLIANKGHLSDSDYTYQSARVGKTSRELKEYIRENYDRLEKRAGRYR